MGHKFETGRSVGDVCWYLRKRETSAKGQCLACDGNKTFTILGNDDEEYKVDCPACDGKGYHKDSRRFVWDVKKATIDQVRIEIMEGAQSKILVVQTYRCVSEHDSNHVYGQEFEEEGTTFVFDLGHKMFFFFDRDVAKKLAAELTVKSDLALGIVPADEPPEARSSKLGASS